MGKVTLLFRKLHRWPGLVISFVLLYYGVTGIIMNHRGLFSGADISRSIMPENYRYRNWNNAALKGNLIISRDSILVYGNIGIWLTDSSFSRYVSMNNGFPGGIDNRKTFDVHEDASGNLYAATFSGLYGFDRTQAEWKKFELDADNERFTGIESIGDTLYAINRSSLFRGKAEGINTYFLSSNIPAPEGYTGKVTLFATIWQIHSGEIFGLPGQFFIDILGIITIFLSITGIIYFFFPDWMKRRIRRNKPVEKISGVNRWSLKWHNKIGAWTFFLLILLFFTGMFLRPPLLIAIANAEVNPIKFSNLDQPNPWYDKLRDIRYDPVRNILLLSTSDGMYFTNPGNLKPKPFAFQPPVSVMGINTLQPYENGAFLIGSFSGLFLWHPDSPRIYNFVTGQQYTEQPSGRPIGDYKVTGTINSPDGSLMLIDYDQGIIPLTANKGLPPVPSEIIETSGMSLWSLCLEIHTGRIFQNLIGDFYILIVPLAGLTGIMVVLSGYLLWRSKYRKKDKRA